MDNLLIIILCVIFFILMIFNQYLQRENFKNYLYPTKGLTNECKKEDGLRPAYMPTSCILDGELKPFRNCKCMNKDGICQSCYPEIKKESKGKSISYNANDLNDNKDELNKRLNTYLNDGNE